MEKKDVKRGGIVYLRFMRFPDSSEIDYRMNGRPYLIYKVDDEFAYLLKVGNSKFLDDDFYLKIDMKVSKKRFRSCYIDLRYLIRIKIDDLVQKANLLFSINKKCPFYIRHIKEKELTKLEEKIERLCMIDQIKEIYTL